MKTQLAIWAGKTAGLISRIIGNGGNTIPGIVARKFDPRFIRHLRNHVHTVIYITGTNGKTTTSNLIAHLLESSGKSVITNREGANMVTGISAALVRHAPLIGWFKNDAAVIEVDEASLPKVVAECPPDYLIITNFFRDQLDRFGEVDLLIEKMKNSLKPLDVKLILNVDDPFTYRFSELQKDSINVGLEADACRFPSYSMTESKYCPQCEEELFYKVLHYGQLGHYHCDCGFTRPETEMRGQKVYQTLQGIHLTVDGEEYPTTLKGMYDAYNALLAISACHASGMNADAIRKGLRTYRNTDGRMQEFVIEDIAWRLNLVKNPAGANVTLSEFLQSKEKKQLIFCLNDLPSDGKDVSWIWDIDMEMANQEEIEQFIASGRRAYDAALRLKYAGIPEERIKIVPNLNHAVLFAKMKGLPVYIMATYTCLAPMVKILAQLTANPHKGGKVFGTSYIPFLPRYVKPLWRQGKYHMLEEEMRMERYQSSNRGNQES